MWKKERQYKKTEIKKKKKTKTKTKTKTMLKTNDKDIRLTNLPNKLIKKRGNLKCSTGVKSKKETYNYPLETNARYLAPFN